MVYEKLCIIHFYPWVLLLMARPPIILCQHNGKTSNLLQIKQKLATLALKYGILVPICKRLRLKWRTAQWCKLQTCIYVFIPGHDHIKHVSFIVLQVLTRFWFKSEPGIFRLITKVIIFRVHLTVCSIQGQDKYLRWRPTNHFRITTTFDM